MFPAPVPALTDWTPLSDGGIYSGTSTAIQQFQTFSGVINYQYYLSQIRENSAPVIRLQNAIKITDGAQ